MLRLGKHPDHGGEVTEAQAINEAYGVLNDPSKRAEYDQLILRADERVGSDRSGNETQTPSSAPIPEAEALLEEIKNRLSPQYREVSDLPLAAAFNLLLEGPPPFRNRLFFTVYDQLSPDHWQRVFNLLRLVSLRRSPWVPRADAVVVVSREVDERQGFLKECLRRSSLSPWTWGSKSLALLENGHLHSEFFLYLPPPLAELRSALTVSA